MSRIVEAVLADGTKIPYVITENPPKGGMKYTYFSPDKSYVVQFFNESVPTTSGGYSPGTTSESISITTQLPVFGSISTLLFDKSE